MSARKQSRFETVGALNEWLAGQQMRGQWMSAGRTAPAGPKPFGVPYIWTSEVIREGLDAALELVPLGKNDARRTAVLIHPSLPFESYATCPSLTVSVQYVLPGEVALAHRHTGDAIRFIVDGDPQAYTVVNGQQCRMERGDLILTPNWGWHEHHNDGEKPVMWVDGLNIPVIATFRAQFFEPFPASDGIQPILRDGDAPMQPGVTGSTLEAQPNQLIYKWRDAQNALNSMGPAERSPFDGRCLEYRAAGGGHTLPTFSCWIQMLDPGQQARSHRHSYSHVYYVFEGEGVTEIDGQDLPWKKGDCFVVPNWTWHAHRNTDPKNAAVLFSMNDVPVMEKIGVLREEAAV